MLELNIRFRSFPGALILAQAHRDQRLSRLLFHSRIVVYSRGLAVYVSESDDEDGGNIIGVMILLPPGIGLGNRDSKNVQILYETKDISLYWIGLGDCLFLSFNADESFG